MVDPFAGMAGTLVHSQTRYGARIRALSDRLVQAQRPIRILDAVKWDDSIERRFFARGCRELPPVTVQYYGSRPLSFEPRKKQQELAALERDITGQLGKNDAPGQIMSRMCREYREVVDLLTRRGTPRFAEISARLYGRTSDPVHAGPYSLAEWARLIESRLHLLPPFRRRLVEIPFQLHHPIWIEDPDFDLEYHVRRAALPAPGGPRELADFAADVFSRHLDRSRPLWEIYAVEGLEHGHIAMISKVTGSTITSSSS